MIRPETLTTTLKVAEIAVILDLEQVSRFVNALLGDAQVAVEGVPAGIAAED